MMDDDFMLSGWRKPPPDFARQLRDRLHGLDCEAASSVDRFKPISRIAACVAALVLVVGAFTFPAVQAGARAFLDLFRIVNFAPVPVQAGRFSALMERQDLDLPRMLSEQVEVLKAPRARQIVADAAAAGAAAGIQVRMPTWRPVGLEPQLIEVSADQALRFTASTAKLKRVLDAFGIDDLSVPDEIDGQSAAVHVPAIVRVSYHSQDHDVVLLQARQPEVSFPGGINLASLAEIGLRVLGLKSAEAHRFAQNVDWRTTLIVPVPADVQVFRQVDIQGNPGLLIETVRRSSRGVLPEESRLLWSSGDSVFALVGNVRPTELFEMAQSVR
ncbi:MAG: hypothetical protein JWO52_2756 [Gammaproteobacteria bacterium]|nr:hypothetical protein [Gammaproteobacteria bacterium]